MDISKEFMDKILVAQKNEKTEYYIYIKLSEKIKNNENRETLKRIANAEFEHYKFWKNITQKEVKPFRFKIFFYYWISLIFGLTFGIKLMEKGEQNAQINYMKLDKQIPGIKKIIEEEEEHEKTLIKLNEEKLKYLGSIVLGLNDALVELTGVLAGLTLALQKTHLIVITGLVTGISASFSMAASEYLSRKSEGNVSKIAFKASVYTGIAYIITVLLLIMPYLFLNNYIICLGITLFTAILIIFAFNYYISIAKDFSFKKRFLEMSFISLGVAGLSFIVGYILRLTLGVDI
ncbi:MAG: VIT1/CCC1 transporter family protein [Clostridiales bacterium]